MKNLQLILYLVLGLSCTNISAADRWYTEKQAENGKPLFARHCASCHGTNAEATPDWRKRKPDGGFPPPPLNGTAHTWHHPMNILKFTILKGGVPVGGNMPAFEQKLQIAEINSIIAWFQSLWPDEVYDIWNKRHPGGAYQLD